LAAFQPTVSAWFWPNQTAAAIGQQTAPERKKLADVLQIMEPVIAQV